MMKSFRFPAAIVIAAALLCPLFIGASPESADSGDAPVYVIPLREDVDRYLGVFLGRSLEAAEAAGAKLIIIEIDTFGGRVDTALEIAGRIGAASSWAETVAYVPADSGGRGVSWSAGALMAFSCSKLYMAPGTSIGAAAPVYQTSEGTQTADEKTVSAVRGQMAALAEKNGYPVEVALAMVDADVVLIEVTLNGRSFLATSADIEAMERRGESPQIGKIISDEGKLLTLTSGEMERYSVSHGSPVTRDELIESLDYDTAAAVVVVKNQADSLLTLLTSAGVTSLLLIAGLVTLYLEITSPGFGIPGTIALICFAVVFGASGLMGNLGPGEILIFLIGIALLLLEIFVIPGFGIAGISGIILILASLVFSMQNFYLPEFEWQKNLALRNLGVVSSGIVGGGVLIGIMMVVLPRAGFFGRLVLHGPGDDGYAGKKEKKRSSASGNGILPPEQSQTSAEQPSQAVNPASAPEHLASGTAGTALTDLRPVGKVRFGNTIAIAQTSGEYCERGTAVVILDRDGVKIVVAPKEEK